MTGPVRYFGRRRLLKKGCSKVPTGIVPLSRISRATVLLDSEAPGAPEAADNVKKFFGGHNIPVTAICPTRKDYTLMGRLKESVRLSGTEQRKEDLFISLVADPKNFAAEYEARCSTASFKAGCIQYAGNVLDLVVSAPEGSPTDQSAVFDAITDCLTKIR